MSIVSEQYDYCIWKPTFCKSVYSQAICIYSRCFLWYFTRVNLRWIRRVWILYAWWVLLENFTRIVLLFRPPCVLQCVYDVKIFCLCRRVTDFRLRLLVWKIYRVSVKRKYPRVLRIDVRIHCSLHRGLYEKISGFFDEISVPFWAEILPCLR